jgi:hypothetical protein
MAKCVARKKRSEKFLELKLGAAKLNPDSKAYDEAAALRALLEILNTVENAEEVERALQCIDRSNSDYLRTHRPRHRYSSARAWIRAVAAEIERVLLPRATRLGPAADELRFLQAAAVLNETYLASELDFERQIDRDLRSSVQSIAAIKGGRAKRLLRGTTSLLSHHPPHRAARRCQTVTPDRAGCSRASPPTRTMNFVTK